VTGTTDDFKSVHFYHCIDLGGGRITDGDFDLRDHVGRYGLPEDLTGLRALDVGCSSGFWSFEMERRGATVVSIDVAAAGQDIWGVVKAESGATTTSSALGPPGADATARSPYALVHQLLGSRAEFRELSVYDLRPEETGTFDLVFCGSLLMHLTDPMRALERIASVARGLVVVSCTYVETLDPAPAAAFKLNPRSFWTPNPACLQALMCEAGLADVREASRIDLRHRRLGLDVPHLVVHGRGRAAEPAHR